MQKTNKKYENRYITRVDHSRTHGWNVRIIRTSLVVTKFFAGALTNKRVHKLAKEYRDSVEKQFVGVGRSNYASNETSNETKARPKTKLVRDSVQPDRYRIG